MMANTEKMWECVKTMKMTKYEKLQLAYYLLNEKCERLQEENARLKAIINAPDIDFPNSEKGGKANPDRPDNCPDFSDF